MKGIVLAAGNGSRLKPLTASTPKALLPVFDKPMIYYSLHTLIRSGITDILVITSKNYIAQFAHHLGDGSEFGVRITYAIQTEPRGTADAFIVAEHWLHGQPAVLMFADNIFTENISDAVAKFDGGAYVFITHSEEPHLYGVITMDESGTVTNIVEKPKDFIGNDISTGLYIFDEHAPKHAKTLSPSNRGELEITDLLKIYMDINALTARKIAGFWEDAGTFESLHRANAYMAKKLEKKF